MSERTCGTLLPTFNKGVTPEGSEIAPCLRPPHQSIGDHISQVNGQYILWSFDYTCECEPDCECYTYGIATQEQVREFLYYEPKDANRMRMVDALIKWFRGRMKYWPSSILIAGCLVVVLSLLLDQPLKIVTVFVGCSMGVFSASPSLWMLFHDLNETRRSGVVLENLTFLDYLCTIEGLATFSVLLAGLGLVLLRSS